MLRSAMCFSIPTSSAEMISTPEVVDMQPAEVICAIKAGGCCVTSHSDKGGGVSELCRF